MTSYPYFDASLCLVAYRGELGDYYCMAAKSVGLPCPDYECVLLAYTEMAKSYPCFGYAGKMPKPMNRSSLSCLMQLDILAFAGVGYEYDEQTFEKIFRRTYASFGAAAPYTVFPDSQPFLWWLHQKGFKVGIVSNGDFRGTSGTMVYSQGWRVWRNRNPKIYEIAFERAGSIAPGEALHIGDNMRKDYVPAKSVRVHALLLDRFKTSYAEEMRKSGAVVLPDLVAAGMRKFH